MRVTKLIREYVEKKVRETYPKSPEELAWEEELDRFHKSEREFEERGYELLKSLAEEINVKYGFEPQGEKELGVLRAYTGRTYGSIDHWGHPIREAARKAQDARSKKIDETIEDILITLEMGGTRADLDAKLEGLAKGE